MASKTFYLRWNDFENNISVAFRELRNDSDFFDVTLACDDEQVQAHKVILSACSPFFRTVLRRNPHAHPLLYLKGVKYSDLQAVLNFMYTGEVKVAQVELTSFLVVAEELRVKGLMRYKSGDMKETHTDPARQDAHPARPGPPDPLEPCPKPKSPRPFLSPALINPSFLQHLEENHIQKMMSVKPEPREPAPPQAATPPPQEAYSHALQAPTPPPQEAYNHALQAANDQYGKGEDYGQGAVQEGGDANKVFVEQDEVPAFIEEHLVHQVDNSGAKFWSCGLCHKILSNKSQTLRHIESYHVQTSPYNCHQCGTQFTTCRSLQRHTSASHK